MWRGALAALAAAALLAGARELDPGACAARFDVQRDKIIRTEESREMGARYLSELDVGARHECRRLCCETDACDVFVYEEKSPGSCYLFNCGPPEDFRCKFTAHSNFSSGVLALSRRLAELQDQERLAPPPPPPRAAPPPATRPAPPPPPPPLAPLSHSTTTTTVSSPAPSPHPARPPPSPQTPPLQTGRCSRYQWECHTGGECIAVYNACDGVPQCADGSDEAPELGCPAAPAPPAAPPQPATPRPAPAPRPPAPAPPEPPSYNPVQVFEQEGGAERWPHRLLQAQPRRFPSSESSGPHIFSHKGGLVQDEAFEPPPAAPAPASWPRRPWPHQSAESGAWGGWGREWGDGGRPWGAAPPPAPDVELPAYLSSGGAMPELPPLYGAPHDQPKKGPRPEPEHAPSPPPRRAEPAAPPPPAHVAAPPAPPPPATQPPHAAPAPAPAARRDPLDDHDGLSERPPAAVLLLVLGVCMTGALGVAAGCRARAAGRRLRRGGRPLQHDADYLVNGMYL